jgi:methionine-rich copper-binding protein CopC
MLLPMKNDKSQSNLAQYLVLSSVLSWKSSGLVKFVSAPIFVLLLVWSQLSMAQHTHGVLSPSVTFPQDDAVLTEEPKMLTMSFRVDVRLLKLALYTDQGEWININFIYDPSRVNHNFVYPLTDALPQAEYYVARWSVVDERQRFLNGEFTFSFGPGAIPPSETIEASYRSIEEENLPSTGAYAQGSN